MEYEVIQIGEGEVIAEIIDDPIAEKVFEDKYGL
jgi:hypothetical protein